MEFRPATTHDLNNILEIIRQAQEFMKSRALDQWQDGYPTREDFEDDIKKNTCFVIETGGETAAVVTLDTAPEPVYDAMSEGKWLTKNTKYAVIHRSAVSNKYRGSGIGDALISRSENIAANQGCISVRVDTHAENAPMRGLLEKHGYTLCGTVYWEGPENPRFARVTYEKILEGRE